MYILLDTNVLLRWLDPCHPDQILLESALKKLVLDGANLCYSSQNLGEFWNVLTRPLKQNGFGLSAQQADRRAHSFESKIILLPDDPAVQHIWRRLLVEYRVYGVQVHDARLVAAMHIHGVKRILTFNTKDFSRFDGIEAIHPAQLA
jgi:predicted nucleic acid-binding protein